MNTLLDARFTLKIQHVILIRSDSMSKVAVINTTPQTVIDDYSKVLDLIDYQSFIKKELDTIIKINLSWSLFYPACSTPHGSWMECLKNY